MTSSRGAAPATVAAAAPGAPALAALAKKKSEFLWGGAVPIIGHCLNTPNDAHSIYELPRAKLRTNEPRLKAYEPMVDDARPGHHWA